ncbi:hypothetical protein FA95DRAFT_1601866 [Auriscalpium vulgare]|uniref:Uncharacterized protein n=1 Tax=Auriscalpium vulgare TaxID=40419 RepID=A0ACB8S8J8_9AGAM|nr:hypothetical protein FA95DRAFT_1601866 [Auriscalpium vulgare]
MTLLFRDMRNYTHIAIVLMAATVLGISAYLASVFLPRYHHDYTIMSLIPPSWTIFILIIMHINGTPRGEVFFLFITDILWLTLAAWTSDMIGPTQCDALAGQRTPTMKGTISSRSYCDLIKVIEAFSWAAFIILLFCFFITIHLANRGVVFGRPEIWREDINELPWFEQAPGFPGAYEPYDRYTRHPHGMPASESYGSNVVQQMPGHNIVIQPGSRGQPRVQQVPSNYA